MKKYFWDDIKWLYRCHKTKVEWTLVLAMVVVVVVVVVIF